MKMKFIRVSDITSRSDTQQDLNFNSNIISRKNKYENDHNFHILYPFPQDFTSRSYPLRISPFFIFFFLPFSCKVF